MENKTLALLHTSMVFINVETMMQNIFKEVMPEVKLINIVDDSLLPEVMDRGKITTPVIKRTCAYINAAEETEADALFCLCSSLGPAVDIAKKLVDMPVIKIDEAMAEKAAKDANKIGVMATVPTTLGPTVDLIMEKAELLGKQVTVEECFVKGGFEELMSGNKDKHDDMVSSFAKDLSSKVEIIVFAQASMTRLAPRISGETGLTVLTSPRLGIEYMKKVLDQLD